MYSDARRSGLEQALAWKLTEVENAVETGAHRRWYACYTRARHEKRVDRLFSERGIESYLPIVPQTRQWKDRKKVVNWPMFPSYVFTRFAPREVSQVLRVPGVVSVVRSNGELVAVSVEELDNVRRFAHALATQQVQPELRPYLAEGQWVRVIDGPFEGITGIVIERRTRKRVLVGLKAIGQGLEVDIGTRSLTPISGP